MQVGPMIKNFTVTSQNMANPSTTNNMPLEAIMTKQYYDNSSLKVKKSDKRIDCTTILYQTYWKDVQNLPQNPQRWEEGIIKTRPTIRLIHVIHIHRQNSGQNDICMLGRWVGVVHNPNVTSDKLPFTSLNFGKIHVCFCRLLGG